MKRYEYILKVAGDARAVRAYNLKMVVRKRLCRLCGGLRIVNILASGRLSKDECNAVRNGFNAFNKGGIKC